MSHNTRFLILAAAAAIAAVSLTACSQPPAEKAAQAPEAAAAPADDSTTVEVPDLELDINWPKQLPNGWIMGAVGAMWVDSKDHVWVAQRPGQANNAGDRWHYMGLTECCAPAPPVMEFAPDGSVVQAWGPLHETDGTLFKDEKWQGDWLASEHGIGVDEVNGAVWVSSYFPPSRVVKYSTDGKKFLLRIGKVQPKPGLKNNDDPDNLDGPTSIVPDPANNEVFIADGYLNRRIIVYDATTGAFKRQWGAYGNKPEGPTGGVPVEPELHDKKGGVHIPARLVTMDYPTLFEPAPADWKDDPAKRSKQFATIHCLHMAKDRLLYVCDRTNNRIQVFKTDGTYVAEGVVAPRTRAWGSLHDLAFSADPEQKYIYVADGSNRKIWIVRRSDLVTLGSFSHGGHGPGEVAVAHAIGSDSKGNVYVGDTTQSNRIMRWLYKGTKRVPIVKE